MGAQLGALRAAAPVDVGGQPDQAHGERGEQEWGAHDRADRHVLALRRADQGDDRNQRLRHGGAHRGEQASHSPLPQTELVPDPLDGVREQQGPGQDDREARDEIDEVHAYA
jgi:hypothetical protein